MSEAFLDFATHGVQTHQSEFLRSEILSRLPGNVAEHEACAVANLAQPFESLRENAGSDEDVAGGVDRSDPDAEEIRTVRRFQLLILCVRVDKLVSA